MTTSHEALHIEKSYIRHFISELAEIALQTSIDKGFNVNRDVPEAIALMHSELSEGLEEYRNDKPNTYYVYDGTGNNKPEGLAAELADCCIRIFQFCAAAGIDIEHAIVEKMAYNKTRPFKHGGKKI